MSTQMMPPEHDPVQPRDAEALDVEFAGEVLRGCEGQTIAGVLLANGIESWRTTSVDEKPRGLFCGIGVCFDCIVTVNGERDVRACQRRARDGDTVTPQDDGLPEVKQ